MWFLDFLVKEISINLLDLICRRHGYTDAVVNHVVCKSISINQDDAGRILPHGGKGVFREDSWVSSFSSLLANGAAHSRLD